MLRFLHSKVFVILYEYSTVLQCNGTYGLPDILVLGLACLFVLLFVCVFVCLFVLHVYCLHSTACEENVTG